MPYQPFEMSSHLVKNGYLVEVEPDGKRKRRHCFLFTDFIACSKFPKLAELTGRQMVVKWFQHLSRVVLKTEPASLVPIASALSNTTSLLLSQATELRNRIVRSPFDQTLRKKLVVIEDKLLMEAADLPLTLVVQTLGGRNYQLRTDTYTFLLGSELERTMWIAAFQTLQSKVDWRFPPKLQRSVVDYYIKNCRVEPISRWINSSDSALVPKGELTVKVHSLMGLKTSTDVFVVVEWDTHGHYLHRCRTRSVDCSVTFWDEQFALQLNGARGLRVLLYEQDGQYSVAYRGGAELKITEPWLRSLNHSITYIPLTQPWFSLDLPYNAGELHLCLSFNFTTDLGKYIHFFLYRRISFDSPPVLLQLTIWV